MKLNIENIFLFDGTGSIFSFLGTGLVFPHFSRKLGVSAETFYFLASFLLIYCSYSFICHFFVSEKKTLGANTSYVCKIVYA